MARGLEYSDNVHWHKFTMREKVIEDRCWYMIGAYTEPDRLFCGPRLKVMGVIEEN
jgi:hypothetical protein